MLSFTRCVTQIFVFWVFISGVSIAQEPAYLKLRPERIQTAREVEQKARAQNDSSLLAEAWYLYGKTYTFSGDYYTAQQYFLKSLRIQERKGDSHELSRLYVRLSENDGMLGRPKKALAYANLALQIAQRVRSDKALIRSYGALGRVHESMWNSQLPDSQIRYDTVLDYYRKEVELCSKLKDTMGIAESTMHVGTFLAKGNDKQAIPYLKQALDLFTRKKKEGVRVKAMTQLAAAYLLFNKPRAAFQILLKADQLYTNRKLKEYDLRLALENGFVTYFKATGQWQKAFDHLRKLNVLERNQILSDRDGAITRLNVEYETEKKEALLQAQRKEIGLNAQNLRLQQLITLITAILFLLASGVSVVFFRLYRKNKRISRWNAELVKEQNHRVKNNLQVVSSLLSLQSKRLTDETAKRAVEESRLRVQSMAILHQRLYDGPRLAEVDLSVFFRELVDGVLRAYGYTTVVTTQFTIDPVTLSADKAVPLGLILNELITNSCKYAFPDNNRPELRIGCQRKNNKIRIIVADNGPGLDDTIVEDSDWNDNARTTVQYSKKRSFGMQLIENQVDQLHGTCKFTSDSGESGTLFTLEFNA